ncbi:MAG: CvpA family protein [bacterium]|nr:CvpA family protein [bacterium]
MITLSLPDFVMVLVIVCFGAFGFALGLIQVVGSLVGMVVGAWLASLSYSPLSKQLSQYFLGRAGAADATAFLVVFLLVNRLSAAVFFVLNRVFRLLSFIPFLKTFNRILGAAFGFLEGALLLGIILRAAQHFSAFPWVTQLTSESKIAGFLLALVQLASPLLPALLSVIRPATPVPNEQLPVI